MKLEDYSSVYFLGVGGIGMSALARWFLSRGMHVAGYDKTETILTKNLEKEGIPIFYEDSVSHIPRIFTEKESTLVVLTPAIPKDHLQWRYFLENGFDIKKRSEILGIITKGHYTIAVAGTHGKTTTSSMIAHILQGSPLGCSAFIGGIMTNYDSNLILGKPEAPVVVEADEFDRSFMRLHPDFSIVTSVDADHLDIYGHDQEVKQSYLDFMQLTDSSGKILLHETVANQVGHRLARGFQTYGLKTSQIRATNIRMSGRTFTFDYIGKTEIVDISLHVPGFHNVTNAVAAITVALHQGMSSDRIKDQLASYAGVKRRFEYIIDSPKRIYIDDYAHHPTEIESLVSSVKKMYPNRRITVIFQPHLFTRTRDFMDGFASSLSLADEVILLNIYPARELPIEGINSDVLFEKIQIKSKYRYEKESFPHVLDQLQPEILLTVGAGDIDTLVPLIKSYWS